MPATSRFVISGLMAVTVAGTAIGQAEAEFPYLAAVTAKGVNIRAGAHFRYYPFGRLQDGDVVRVVGHKGNWARVETMGPAFDGFFAYIKYPITETGHLELNAEATAGEALVPLDLFAPNLDAGYEPKSSWKWVLTLPAGRTVKILQSREVRGERVHRVPMPAEAQGWINLERLRRATPAEHAAFGAAVAQRSAPGRPQPEPPAAAPTATAQATLPAASIQPRLPRDSVPRVGGAELTELAGPPAPPAQRHSTPAPATRVPGSAARKLRELEATYAELLAEPTEQVEVGGLRLEYLELARAHRSHKALVEYAENRARQLELWADVKQQKGELARLLARTRLAAREVHEARWSLESAAGYVAIGRLDASRIYDGTRLPKLLRLREASGRTIAYLTMDNELGLSGKIGELIGIVGERVYDGSLRLNILRPERIEILTPAGEKPESQEREADNP